MQPSTLGPCRNVCPCDGFIIVLGWFIAFKYQILAKDVPDDPDSVPGLIEFALLMLHLFVPLMIKAELS